MKHGTTKEDSKLTGQFAQDLESLVKNYLNMGGLDGAVANHLEGMSNRVREGEFRKEVRP